MRIINGKSVKIICRPDCDVRELLKTIEKEVGSNLTDISEYNRLQTKFWEQNGILYLELFFEDRKLED